MAGRKCGQTGAAILSLVSGVYSRYISCGSGPGDRLHFKETTTANPNNHCCCEMGMRIMFCVLPLLAVQWIMLAVWAVFNRCFISFSSDFLFKCSDFLQQEILGSYIFLISPLKWLEWSWCFLEVSFFKKFILICIDVFPACLSMWGCLIPSDWNYKQLWAEVVLGIEP